MTRVPCYLELETAAKNEIINEAFHELGTFFPETLEKDIWLCHVLDVLFSLPGLPMLVFRGGTLTCIFALPFSIFYYSDKYLSVFARCDVLTYLY